MMNPGLFTVTLSPDQVIQAELLFEPSEVKAYLYLVLGNFETKPKILHGP